MRRRCQNERNGPPNTEDQIRHAHGKPLQGDRQSQFMRRLGSESISFAHAEIPPVRLCTLSKPYCVPIGHASTAADLRTGATMNHHGVRLWNLAPRKQIPHRNVQPIKVAHSVHKAHGCQSGCVPHRVPRHSANSETVMLFMIPLQTRLPSGICRTRRRWPGLMVQVSLEIQAQTFQWMTS